MTVKRKALEVAAQELNFFLDPNPPINIKEKSDVLKQKVIEAGNLLEDGEQELSLSTTTGLEGDELEQRKTKIAGIQNTLKELGVKLFGGETVETTEQNETEEPIKENLNPRATLTEMVQEAKKLVDLKAIVEAEDEFKPLRELLDDYTGLAGLRLLKAEMLKVLGVEVKKPETKTKEKKEKKEKIGIGTFIRSILTDKDGWIKTNKEITEAVLSKFPNANTKPHNISWYRNKIKNNA